MHGIPPSEDLFDLSQASALLYPFTRRSLYVSLFLVCFLIVLAVVILVVDWHGIVSHSLDSYQIFGVVVVLGLAVFGLGVTLPLIPRQRKGASAVRVSDEKLDLIYDDGKHDLGSWTDARLGFELIDFSDADPSVLPTSEFPYQINFEGRMSLLTEPAYRAILYQVASHGLQDRVARGGTWRFPARANPLIHHIRASGRAEDEVHRSRFSGR